MCFLKYNSVLHSFALSFCKKHPELWIDYLYLFSSQWKVVLAFFHFFFKVRIRESNFHSSLIQGPQNFDTTIQSEAGGQQPQDNNGGAANSGQNHPQLKKQPPQRASSSNGGSNPASKATNPSSTASDSSRGQGPGPDSKMPVEQLTSHVLSSAAAPSSKRFDDLSVKAIKLAFVLCLWPWLWTYI